MKSPCTDAALEEQFRNNDLENRTGVTAPLTSRRTFIRAAAGASGAGTSVLFSKSLFMDCSSISASVRGELIVGPPVFLAKTSNESITNPFQARNLVKQARNSRTKAAGCSNAAK